MRNLAAAKWMAVALVLLGGCSRNRYRVAADAETYAVLDNKITGRPWQPPGFTIQVDPRSRMFDPTNPNAPTLPYPGPRLYAYQLPPLMSQGGSQRPSAEEVPAPEESLPPPAEGIARLPAVEPQPNPLRAADSPAQVTARGQKSGVSAVRDRIASLPNPVRRIFAPKTTPAQAQASPGGMQQPVVSGPVTYDQRRVAGNKPSSPEQGAVQPASFRSQNIAQNQQPVIQPVVPPPGVQPPAGGERISAQPAEPEADKTALPVIHISPATWDSIPQQYLGRMFVFDSIRQEYVRTYGVAPQAQDTGERLSLEQIIEAALINSREYQTQKEVLYRAALALTLERFDYAIKFTPFGNGVDLDYTHRRTNGITVNTLGVSPQLQLNKMLASGGTIIGTFANNVLLTFNGPQGFNANIGSDLIFGITQPLLQRDIQFENLTQAERNVVYAARNYARFRKQFFTNLSGLYYNLLTNYRGIEIDAQNYFSLARAFDQAQAELVAGLQSRIQVEQIEQRMLAGRSGLISDFVTVERLLDQLKIQMGLPTEYPLDLDLSELFDVSLRDQVAVTGEVVRRARGRLLLERQESMPDRGELVNAGATLAERMQEWIELQTRLGEAPANRELLEDLNARLGVDKARLDASIDRRILQEDLQSGQAPPIRLFQRTMDAIDSALELVNRLLTIADRAGRGDVAPMRSQLADLRSAAAQLRQRLSTALEQARLEDIAGLLADSQQLLAAVDAALAAADRQAGGTGAPLGQGEDLSRVLQQTDELLAIAGQLLTSTRTGLT
ncbi:MAG: TolC family protein, partial [Planctomycetes bacterium]|nr:TolC family protein [Planctomycetota bacterium]